MTDVKGAETVTTRWMTPEAKARELAYWADVRAKRDAMPEAPRGGLGYPDPEIYALTDRLNALRGVCTLQSCAGHRVPTAPGSRLHHRYPGALWLWFSASVWRAFHERVYELAGSPLVERVSTLHRAYHDGPREVVEIEFHGLAEGRLRESSELIVGFVESLVPRCGSCPADARCPECDACEWCGFLDCRCTHDAAPITLPSQFGRPGGEQG